jgi:uncharacterized protein YjiK
MLMWRNMAILQVIKTRIFLLLFLSALTGCAQDNKTYTLFTNPGYDFPFQLSKPDKLWKLPFTLVEISGLSFTGDDRLACVQDEKGIVYIFNQHAGEVEAEVIFGEDGDYEDIEIVENDAWVLKSNGTLYKVADYLKKAVPGEKKYPTALSGKNDAEGLAYDPVSKTLLIACKENPFVDEKKGSGFKSVYSFNLETKLIDLNPFLLISQDTIRHYKGGSTFKPSGIAIHPITGEVYILGSVGKLLLVLSRAGEMLAVINLNPMVFPQPEGICFSPDGTLYISNEGAGRSGTILKFEPVHK